MEIEATAIAGVRLIRPVVHGDTRGFFLETWHADRYAEAGIDLPFVQDNHSRSTQGILRGLHLQTEKPQGKLVRVTSGAVFDVVVMTPSADFLYKCTDVYHPQSELSLAWDDPTVGIKWPLASGHAPILSDKDRNGLPWEAIPLYPDLN